MIKKGKDAFMDLLCYNLANDVSYISTPEDSPIHFSIINHDHCPEGYRGISVFIRDDELEGYEETTRSCKGGKCKERREYGN